MARDGREERIFHGMLGTRRVRAVAHPPNIMCALLLYPTRGKSFSTSVVFLRLLEGRFRSSRAKLAGFFTRVIYTVLIKML
jgi:hypothetical protein